MKKSLNPKRWGKKGVITDFLGSIGNFIQGILQTIPAPILFIIFLFIIVTVAWILSIIFSAFGIFCTSANEPVQLNTNFIDNIGMIGQIPDPKDIGKQQLNVPEFGVTGAFEGTTKCTQTYNSGTIYLNDTTSSYLGDLIISGIYPQILANDIITIITNPPATRYAVNITQPINFYDGTFCTNCQKVTVCQNLDCVKVCLGDVNRLTNEQKGFLQKSMCGWFGCEPPEHYSYNAKANAYLCSDSTCATVTMGTKWDELLNSKGATLLHPTASNTQDTTSTGFLGITCTELRPRLAVFGIEIFTYTYWLIISLIILAFWGLEKARGGH